MPLLSALTCMCHCIPHNSKCQMSGFCQRSMFAPYESPLFCKSACSVFHIGRAVPNTVHGRVWLSMHVQSSYDALMQRSLHDSNEMRQSTPVGPVSPVEPVNPVGPLGPVGPVGPLRPVPPVGPVAPNRPVAPVAPVGPKGMQSLW